MHAYPNHGIACPLEFHPLFTSQRPSQHHDPNPERRQVPPVFTHPPCDAWPSTSSQSATQTLLASQTMTRDELQSQTTVGVLRVLRIPCALRRARRRLPLPTNIKMRQ